jgi:hypothetical protein
MSSGGFKSAHPESVQRNVVQSKARVTSVEGGPAIRELLTSPNQPALHAVLVSMSSSLRGRPAPASAVRAESGDVLGRLKRLVDLQAKVTSAIAEEEDFLYGTVGISFRAISRIRGLPEWWVAREYRQRHQEWEQVTGM